MTDITFVIVSGFHVVLLLFTLHNGIMAKVIVHIVNILRDAL